MVTTGHWQLVTSSKLPEILPVGFQPGDELERRPDLQADLDHLEPRYNSGLQFRILSQNPNPKELYYFPRQVAHPGGYIRYTALGTTSPFVGKQD